MAKKESIKRKNDEIDNNIIKIKKLFPLSIILYCIILYYIKKKNITINKILNNIIDIINEIIFKSYQNIKKIIRKTNNIIYSETISYLNKKKNDANKIKFYNNKNIYANRYLKKKINNNYYKILIFYFIVNSIIKIISIKSYLYIKFIH